MALPFFKQMSLFQGKEFVLGEVSIAPIAMVQVLKNCPKLAVLNLSQNTFPEQQITELCDVIRTNLTQLKVQYQGFTYLLLLSLF
jgi:Ran GTPase-activating protein (RanGAP) involved in mRNA processing and transport